MGDDPGASRRLSPTELLGPLNETERKHAPSFLYVAGQPDILRAAPRVAVIGSRRATARGLEAAACVSSSLVDADYTVVSGLAEGIDTAAHRATLDAGGRTVAVLGTPLDRAFPSANAALQHLIMRDHLAVSQFPSGTRTQPAHFVMRNRTMALLVNASIIVEAGESSGTLHQGWEMLRLGRALFLHPLVLSDSRLSWPRKMLDYGALAFEGVPQLAEALPLVGLDLGHDAPF